MGYTVEISFNLLKHSAVKEIQNELIDVARECCCSTYYIDFEMEHECNAKRNHCVITVLFENECVYPMIDFLKFVKCCKKFYIETLYCNEPNKCIYASKYHLIQNAHKMSTKVCNTKNSDIENMILDVLNKKY